MENPHAKDFLRLDSAALGNGLVLIPARGGSKGIPMKNLYPLCGKPLLSYTLEQAQMLAPFCQVVVSTDHGQIAEAAEAFGARVLWRPAHLSTDTSKTVDTVIHSLEILEGFGQTFDYVILLQCTSPFRKLFHIVDCLELYNLNKCPVVSVTEAVHHPYKSFVMEDGHPMPVHEWHDFEMPRQQLSPAFCVNGAIYIIGVESLLRERRFVAPGFTPYFMDAESSVDIDDLSSMHYAEWLIHRQSRKDGK